MTDRLEIDRRRERLQRRIEVWHRQGSEHLSQSTSEDLEVLEDQLDYNPQWADPLDEAENPFTIQAEESPESSLLVLPSAITVGCPTALSAIELELRQGQANDALHAIRLGLVSKARLFRTSVRNAGNYTRRTRAWDSVNSEEANLRHHARVYSRARGAMINLGARASILSLYQELRPEHLKATTAIMDPMLPNHRNDKLAWFWKVNTSLDTEGEDNWMLECKPQRFFPSGSLTLTSVYRVHWIRSLARLERWKEELELVKHEMQWTVQYFRNRGDSWNTLATSTDNIGVGERCYSAKQADLWNSFVKQAEAAFDSILLQ